MSYVVTAELDDLCRHLKLLRCGSLLQFLQFLEGAPGEDESKEHTKRRFNFMPLVPAHDR